MTGIRYGVAPKRSTALLDRRQTLAWLAVKRWRYAVWRSDILGRAAALAVACGMTAATAVAQDAGEALDASLIDPAGSVADGTAAPATAADERRYVIPFMALTDIETDFSLTPSVPDDVLRDASIESIDALFDGRRARQ